MGKNQRVIIFVAIAALMLSVVGTSILILTGEDTNVSHNSSDTASSQQLQEIEDQLREQQVQEALQQQAQEAAASCSPLGTPNAATGKTVPDFALPTTDVTELGLLDLTEGTGTEAQAGDCIVAYYHGVLTDGTVFDSAYDRGVPNRFSLQRVVQGWQLGIPGMKEGGVRVLTIPSELAYGSGGSGALIGPDADLVFVVELVEVVEL